MFTNLEQNPLYEFAYFPKEKILSDLSSIAKKEIWGHPEDDKDYSSPILFHYVIETFARAREINYLQFSESMNLAVFNTGLFTSYQQPIYGIFTKNYKYIKPPFYFSKVCIENDANLDAFPVKPCPPYYFSSRSELVFDLENELIINYPHLLEDNRKRFPALFDERSEIFLITHFRGALIETLELIEHNELEVQPQFYKGKIQFLIPLYLSDTHNSPDVAIAVESKGNTNYVHTILTMAQAYNNARLLGPVQASWLKI